MAKPMPTEPPDCEKIIVLMPTSLPSMSTSAPPELPGLMAASVWMNTCVSDCAISVRVSAEMMPLVTVWPDAERVADREHEVAHLELVGVGELADRGSCRCRPRS